ncbi:MAG TPA: DUF4926 domain-containing protein [Afifellaceae bacterium]|nr:DUF4926 domain-containing protein [Afifellaceae bacterium]
MADQDSHTIEPTLLDVVALLAAKPDDDLRRGEVGTVVEDLDAATVLVEFSDDEGRAYAIVPCRRSELLVLHTVSRAA